MRLQVFLTLGVILRYRRYLIYCVNQLVHYLRELQRIYLRQVADFYLVLAEQGFKSHVHHADIILSLEQRSYRTWISTVF